MLAQLNGPLTESMACSMMGLVTATVYLVVFRYAETASAFSLSQRMRRRLTFHHPHLHGRGHPVQRCHASPWKATGRMYRRRSVAPRGTGKGS